MSKYKEYILDRIKYELSKDDFEYLENKQVFTKKCFLLGKIGLQDKEIYVRYDFIENIVNKCIKEIVDLQLKDLQSFRDEL